MAVTRKSLDVVGPDMSYVFDDVKEDLATIMVAMLYNQPDKAASILMQYNNDSIMLLQDIMLKLKSLSFACMDIE